MGRTWDAVIDQFAERNIPIRTIERVSGLIVTDDLTVGTDGYWWADCGRITGVSTVRRKKQSPTAESNDSSRATNASHLGPTRATYNILVRGDSLESTVKATVRWTHVSEKAVVKECTTNHSWERGLEEEVKKGAELHKQTATVVVPQEPESAGVGQPTADSTGDSVNSVPAGTKWVADKRSKTYYPVRCPAAARIVSADRLYYMTEGAALVAGFRPSLEC